MEAMILDIQRLSTEDGPGLRTTVFFKGCNLACPWCHNPESISPTPDLLWYGQKCIGCGICRGVCPQGAIRWDSQGLDQNPGPDQSHGDGGRHGDNPSHSLHFQRSLCRGCGNCAAECPGGAIEMKGRRMELEALCGELLKDQAYFGAEGGVTFSGGEAMLQSEAVRDLARRLSEAGVSTALDTAGCYPFEGLEAALPFISLVLYDLKILDPQAHKRIIRADNRLILENYRRLADRGVRVWVRTPIIEGATDNPENIEAIGGFLAEAGPPEKWELCSFNNLCRDKYERLDREWAYKDTGLTPQARIEALTALAGRFVPRAEYSGRVK